MTVEEGLPTQQEVGALGGEPNEAVASSTGFFSLGHRMVRVGVGTVFLGLDQVQALLEHAVNRGERVEGDAHRAAARLRQQSADAVHGAASGVSRRSTAAWSAGLASVMNKLPGVSLAYKPPESASRPPVEPVEPAEPVSPAGEDVKKSVAQVTINDFESTAY